MSTVVGHRSRQLARSVQSVTSSLGEKPSSATVKVPTKHPTLAKRLLFPHLPADAPLPPLLVSPSASPELNTELYDFIAIALRAYVNPWWTKLTRYDKEFLPQITIVLTAVIRTLESRLTSTDLSPFVFRDLPAILTQHHVDYRNAHSKLHTSYAAGGAASLPQLFHQMQPHMAVSAEGIIDEAYVRMSVDQVLKACLPSENYDPEPERYIIREIVVMVVLKSVIPRLTQPWFLHKLILDQLGPDKEMVQPQQNPETASDPTSSSTRPPLQRQRSHTFSFQSVAIFVLSAVQSISGFCLTLIHAYKQTVGTIKKVNQSAGVFPQQHLHNNVSQTGSTDSEDDTASLRSTLPGTLVPMTPGLPPSPALSKSTSSTSSTFSVPSAPPQFHASSAPPAPNYTQPSLQLLSVLLSPPPPPSTPAYTQRSSYSTPLALTHILSLILTLLSPFISRLLPYLLYTHVFSPSSIANIVRNTRRALFPEGWPAPPPVDPTPEEQVDLRKELGRRLESLVPSPLAPLLGPTPTARSATISGILDPLSSQACNAHLMMFVLDLILVTLFPEMAISETVVPVVAGDDENGDGAGNLTPPRPESRPP